MPYELRAKGRTAQTFDTEDEAVAGARALIHSSGRSRTVTPKSGIPRPASLLRPPRVRHGARISPAKSASDAVGQVRQTWRRLTRDCRAKPSYHSYEIRLSNRGFRPQTVVCENQLHCNHIVSMD